MIENEKQLTITEDQILRFNLTIKRLKEQKVPFKSLLAEAELNALICQRDELVKQVEEYKKRGEER